MVPYKKQTSAELDDKINYYFEKSFAMADFDLEAMMMFARNLTEVITSKLYIDIFSSEPSQIKEYELQNGIKKEQKVLMPSRYKIRELEKSDKLPQSLLITLSMLSSAGNVSVHGSEILDSELKIPFRGIISFICKWYYEKHMNIKVPKNIKYKADSNSVEKDEKPFVLKENLKSKKFDSEIQYTNDDEKYYLSGKVFNNKGDRNIVYASLKFTTQNDLLTFKGQIKEGDFITLESAEIKLVIQLYNLSYHKTYPDIVSGKYNLDLFTK